MISTNTHTESYIMHLWIILTLWQLRSNLCLAHSLIATNENKMDGTEKAILNHSTALGLNQMSSIAGSGPTKTVCRKGGRGKNQ